MDKTERVIRKGEEAGHFKNSEVYKDSISYIKEGIYSYLEQCKTTAKNAEEVLDAVRKLQMLNAIDQTLNNFERKGKEEKTLLDRFKRTDRKRA